MRRTKLVALIWALTAAAPSQALSHTSRPGLLTIRALGENEWRADWRPPEPSSAGVGVRFAPACAPRRAEDGSWTLRCDAASLTVTLHGPQGADVFLVEGGASLPEVQRLVAGRTWRPRAARRSNPADALPVAGFFRLGFEHILLGYDHLAFLLGLLLLMPRGRRLVGVLSAFTVAHSVTLGLAALDLVQVPVAPVEAMIAISVVFVARAAALGREESSRRAFVVAVLFGLLHGLGFANALTGLGLPTGAELTALALFNVGVEAGQLSLAVISLVGAKAFTRILTPPRARVLHKLTSYGLGAIAALWTMQRVASMGGVG